MIDVDALLAPVSDQPPCGPDLEYDPEWQELERLAQGKPEQQFGGTIIPAEEPDWRDVAERAQALLGRSKDVRSACLLARASMHLDQFAGLKAGLELVHQLLERYWAEVHPMLDSSDNDDPTMRLNALSVLADSQGFLRAARNVRVVQSREHGEVTLRQIEIAAGKLQAREGESAPSQSQIDQQLAGVLSADPDLAARVSAALASAKALAKLLDDRVGSDRSTDLKPLLVSLTTLNQCVARIAATQAGTASSDDSSGADDTGTVPGAQSAGGPAINAASGSIRNRSDVVLLLDRICEFLARTEPTNPVPLVLQRAKRLMTMNFMELMGDLAPDGIDQVRKVTGEKPAGDDE